MQSAAVLSLMSIILSLQVKHLSRWIRISLYSHPSRSVPARLGSLCWVSIYCNHRRYKPHVPKNKYGSSDWHMWYWSNNVIYLYSVCQKCIWPCRASVNGIELNSCWLASPSLLDWRAIPLIAATTCLNAITSVRVLFFVTESNIGGVTNASDAMTMQNITKIHYYVWSSLWMGLALWMTAMGIFINFETQQKQQSNNVVVEGFQDDRHPLTMTEMT